MLSAQNPAMEALTTNRLNVERKNCAKSLKPGFKAGPIKNPDNTMNLKVWACEIPGKAGTDWEGGVFPLTITFGPDYPRRSPNCKWNKQIYHPNFYRSGDICLSIIGNAWKPQITVIDILYGIQELFDTPNPNSPANVDANKQYLNFRNEYNKRIRLQAIQFNPDSVSVSRLTDEFNQMKTFRAQVPSMIAYAFPDKNLAYDGKTNKDEFIWKSWTGSVKHAGIIYALNLNFANNYPTEPPIIKFSQPIFHPNVQDGVVSISRLTKDRGWTPGMSVVTIMDMIHAMLNNPDLTLIVNTEAGEMYKNNKKAYEEKIMSLAKAYDPAEICATRLGEERALWRKDHPFGFFAKPTTKSNDLGTIWSAGIPGRPGIWQGGSYKFDLIFPKEYPNSAPIIKFKPGFFHPNIDDTGLFNIPILKEQYNPSLTLKEILLAVQECLHSPQMDCVSQNAAYALYKRSIAEYNARVKKQAQEYAI